MNSFLSSAGEVLLRASWQAAVLALIIFILQWVFGTNLSARWRYNLWMLVVLRLLLPAVPATHWSVHNWIAMPHKAPAAKARQAAVVEADISVVVLESSSIALQTPPPPAIPPAPTKSWRNYVIPAAWALWLCGFIFCFLRTIRASAKLCRQSRRFTPVLDPSILQILDQAKKQMRIGRGIALLSASDLSTPALMGLFHPRILLPAKVINEFRPSELRLIFLHELAHLRRGDIAVNWLISLLNMLHWFNPLLWLAFARMRAERELACDELVLKITQPDERREYGNTMIKLLDSFCGGKALPGAVGILEGQAPLRRRITMIAQFERRQSRTWIALLTILILAMVALTDAAVAQQRNNPARRGAVNRPAAPAEGGPAVAPGAERGGGGGGGVAQPGQGVENPRFGSGEQDKNTEAANEKTRAALRRTLPEVKFENVILKDVIAFLQDVTELNIYVDWKNMEASGIAQDTSVSLRLRNVPAGEVLRLVLREASPQVRYQIESGIVVISTAVSQPVAVIKAYNVDDLCYSDATFAFRRKVLEEELKTAADDAAKNQVNQQLRDFQMMIDQTKGGRMQELVGLIQTTVAPYAASNMSVRAFDTKLIVTADEAGHQEVAKVLLMLRDRGEGAGDAAKPDLKRGAATAP